MKHHILTSSKTFHQGHGCLNGTSIIVGSIMIIILLQALRKLQPHPAAPKLPPVSIIDCTAIMIDGKCGSVVSLPPAELISGGLQQQKQQRHVVSPQIY